MGPYNLVNTISDPSNTQVHDIDHGTLSDDGKLNDDCKLNDGCED